MKLSKRMCKNGSVNIPKQVRVEAGIFPGNAVDIEALPSGKILITPSAPCCRFCGSPDQLLFTEGVVICKKCANKLLKKVGVCDE